MSEIYFENVPNVGDLYLNRTLNVFEGENIIFICTDIKREYYLCTCYEFRDSLKWIIAKTDAKNLLKMLEKKIDIHSVYESSELLINCIYDGEKDTFVLTNYNSVDKRIIPNKGTYLKPDNKDEVDSLIMPLFLGLDRQVCDSILHVEYDIIQKTTNVYVEMQEHYDYNYDEFNSIYNKISNNEINISMAA